MDYTVCEIIQARMLECIAFPSPGDFPNPRIEPRSPTLTKPQSFHYSVSSSGLLGLHPLALYLFSPRATQKLTFPHHLHILTFYSLSSLLQSDFCSPHHCQTLWRVCNLHLVGLSDAFETIESFLCRGFFVIWCLWQCSFLFLLLLHSPGTGL